MFIVYTYTIAGLAIIILTVLVQNIVAAVAHRKQSSYVPGKVAEDLSHDSFVFRSHRTFHNSLENVNQFIIPAILCMFVGVTPLYLAILAWVYGLCRIVHMALYYAMATERNPSPRTYFYMIGLVTNLILYVLLFMSLI
ncbi:MAPEG family protein [Alteromonas stellipolaris]|uniref:MAPEG family protein n=1 Tax=Alteromonas stellipolaris TaxID=233316 RepID=UPI0026E16B0F|nr:MAPEG family protein [Alteromonas stellipolaris]MDO6536298.1 MAPEG family protein [Alteromonas stellipolaris]MDO6627904.1 MAPEG family protein [Alteromonas stellipolaris]